MGRKNVSYIRRETEEQLLKKHQRDMNELLYMIRAMYPEWHVYDDTIVMLKFMEELEAGRAGFF